MKKVLSLLLILAFMLSFAVLSNAKVGFVYGDVNESGGMTDDLDAMMLARYLANWDDIVINLALADGNNDGVVDEVDDMLMTRYLAGWSDDVLGDHRWDQLFEDPNPTYELEVTINNAPETLEIGESWDVDCDVVLTPELGIDEEPVIEYKLNSGSTAIAVDHDTVTAKKLGTSVVTVNVMAYYPEAGISVEGYTTLKITGIDNPQAEKDEIVSEGVANYYVNTLASATSYMNYFVEQVAEKTGATMENIYDTEHKTVVFDISSSSDLRSGGYKIYKSGLNFWVVAKDSEGMDKAVRYLLKYYIDEETGTFAIPNDINIIEGEGKIVKSMTIGGNDISDYVIVKPGSLTDSRYLYVTAANELNKYINRATGVSLPIISVDEIGNYSNKKFINLVYDDTADIAVDENGKYKFNELNYIVINEVGQLGNDGYTISSSDGNLTIMGAPQRGLLYGAYEFLERYVGVRFLDEGLKHIYESDGFNIPNGLNFTEKEVMSYRHVSSNALSESEFAIMRRSSYGTSSSRGGGYYTTWYHAHSFEYQFKTASNGQPIAWNNQPCLSAPGADDECWNSIVELIDSRTLGKGGNYIPGQPGLNQITVAWNDNENYCNCSRCRKINRDEGGTISGTLVQLVNEIADRLAVAYPGMEVFTIGYGTTARIPTKTPLRDNVVLCYCWAGCNNHPFDGSRCPEEGGRLNGFQNIKDSQYYEGWIEKSSHTYVWYYCANYHAYLSPLPIMYNIYDDMNYLASVGNDGIYAEMGNKYKMFNYERMNSYMLYQIMWDPFMSFEEYMDIMNEYMYLYYGDGWESIMEYFEMWEEASELKGKCWLTNFSRPDEMVSFQYYADNYDKLCELYDNAIAMANDADQQRMLEFARCSMEFVALSGMYDDMYVNGDEAQQAFYVERYQKLYNFIDANKYVAGTNENGICLNSPGDVDYFPESADEICSPMSWYDYLYIYK